MLNKYIFIACFLLSLEGGAQGGGSNLPPPNGLPVDAPPGHECCEDYAPKDGQPFPSGSEEEKRYADCIANPTAYCTVPIDNSIYIYISIVAGVALASFVIARRIKT